MEVVFTNKVFPLVPALLSLYVKPETRSVYGSAVSERYAPPPYADAVHPVNVVELTVNVDELERLAEIAPPFPELVWHELK